MADVEIGPEKSPGSRLGDTGKLDGRYVQLNGDIGHLSRNHTDPGFLLLVTDHPDNQGMSSGGDVLYQKITVLIGGGAECCTLDQNIGVSEALPVLGVGNVALDMARLRLGERPGRYAEEKNHGEKGGIYQW